MSIHLKSPFFRSRCERLIFALGCIHLCYGAWLKGGYYWLAPWLMGISGWLAFLIALVLWRRPSDSSDSNPAWRWRWLCWMGLTALLAASLVNPAYRFITGEAGEHFVWRSHFEWLPSVVSVERSARMIAQFTGSLCMAWALLAALRSEKWIHALMWVCLANAFILALLGAFFKAASAENPLGLFASVNSRFFASFTYHNHWVAYAVLNLFSGLALFAYYSSSRVRRQARANAIPLLGVMAFFIWLSLALAESRLGALLATVFLACVFFQLGCRFLRSAKGMGLAILAMLLLGFAIYRISEKPLQTVGEKYVQAWKSYRASDSEVDAFRFGQSTRISKDLIASKPVFGWGFGSYAYAMRIYAPRHISDGRVAQFAHCDWLQFMAELGIVGFLLFAIPLLVAIRESLKSKAEAKWIGVGLLAILALATIEFPLSNPAVLAHFLAASIFFLKVGGNPERR